MTVSAAAAKPVTVFARGPFQAGGVVILEPDEAHHLKVRRVESGATVRLVDGRGGVATARVAPDGEHVAARVVATASVSAPPASEIWVGAGDRDRFLDLVEKATELGATRILPLVTDRSQTVATRFQAVHLEKAVRRACEALKQCGGTWMPVVQAPLTLAEALRAPAGAAKRFVADIGGPPLPPVREADGVQWAVGPEGGWTDADLAALHAAGFSAVGLGRATLRFDTAALAALAVIAQARLG